MIENETKVLLMLIFFSEIMLAEHGAYNHDLKKDIKMLVKIYLIIVFNMINMISYTSS